MMDTARCESSRTNLKWNSGSRRGKAFNRKGRKEIAKFAKKIFLLTGSFENQALLCALSGLSLRPSRLNAFQNAAILPIIVYHSSDTILEQDDMEVNEKAHWNI